MGVRRRKADKRVEEQSWLLGNSCAGFFFSFLFLGEGGREVELRRLWNQQSSCDCGCPGSHIKPPESVNPNEL